MRRGLGTSSLAPDALAEPAPPRLLTDWELWACANHYVTTHGEDAPIIAALRADELLADGDLDGVDNFHAIIRRIHAMLGKGQGRSH
jgi:hypothetical protein